MSILDANTDNRRIHDIVEILLPSDTCRISIPDALSLYLASKRKNSNNISTHIRIWNDFISFMSVKYNKVEFMDNIETFHLESYFSYLEQNGRFKKNNNLSNKLLSNKTLNDFHFVLKGVFKKTLCMDSFHKNPMDNIEKKEKCQVDREAFSDNEIRQILNFNDFVQHTRQFASIEYKLFIS